MYFSQQEHFTKLVFAGPTKQVAKRISVSLSLLIIFLKIQSSEELIAILGNKSEINPDPFVTNPSTLRQLAKVQAAAFFKGKRWEYKEIRRRLKILQWYKRFLCILGMRSTEHVFFDSIFTAYLVRFAEYGLYSCIFGVKSAEHVFSEVFS